MIETKVAVGSFTGIITGLLTWALVAYVPAFKSGLPPQLAAFIPVIAAWLAHSAAAYFAPHTSRPLPVQVSAPSLNRGGYSTGSTTVSTPPPAREPGGTA